MHRFVRYIPGNYYITKKPKMEPQQNGLVNSMYITDIRDPIEISNVREMFYVMIFIAILFLIKFVYKATMNFKKSIQRQYTSVAAPLAQIRTTNI